MFPSSSTGCLIRQAVNAKTPVKEFPSSSAGYLVRRKLLRRRTILSFRPDRTGCLVRLHGRELRKSAFPSSSTGCLVRLFERKGDSRNVSRPVQTGCLVRLYSAPIYTQKEFPSSSNWLPCQANLHPNKEDTTMLPSSSNWLPCQAKLSRKKITLIVSVQFKLAALSGRLLFLIERNVSVQFNGCLSGTATATSLIS